MILWDTIGSIVSLITWIYIPPQFHLVTPYISWMGWAIILMVTYLLSTPKLNFHTKSILLLPIAQIITLPAMFTNPYHIFEYTSEILWIIGVLKTIKV